MVKDKKFHLIIFGCQMNYSDAERLSTVLKKLGYKETKDEAKADLIAIVACSVKQAAVDRIHSKIHKWQLTKETRPLITILSGCVLKNDQKKLAHQFDLFIDIKNLENLADDIASIHPEEKLALPDFFDISPSYGSNYRAYVPIMTGCNKFCSYCAVPYTRGRETSRPSEHIIKEVKELLDKGYKEIVLLGQNVNSYGLDKKGSEISFPELLTKIDSLSDHFWLKFLTSHPYDMSDELIDTMAKCKNLNDYLHLPVQCGSDEVLKKMNRHYTVAEYKKLIKKIKKQIPEMTLSTDIIVGFCGETDKDFEATQKLVKDVDYNLMYISQYSTRIGTVAAKMHKDDVPKTIKKKRWKEMNDQLRIQSTDFNKKLVGQKRKVLIDSIKKEGNKIINTGKLSNYLPVHIESSKTLNVGEFYQIEITEALHWGVKAKLI
ncbi:MAG: tRNA (N6-isopentenyl adenosine(37)-C2)-methylthiotransferase MiaB [Candidatus Komeilibacteria bacterium]|jgi:tRNA-2-methylthio-N6-dimethylallyladenosine synthase|nr:tRNA (N6-isopentenyl adenosine(37)-C2)-methylthiotransferase MiaB [Candidatus Komeilibacteria bacterium]MBT4447904.1 tRNA (N6-isopentenyl adenosine(37)-C2)-methylthiotransferase MiaB [Candidatus Komeilibacteria bacterium]